MPTKTKTRNPKKNKQTFGSNRKKRKGEENTEIKQQLEKAVIFHNQGYLQQALDAYRNILIGDPNNPDANHLLGVLTNQIGNPKAAIALIRKAIENKPSAIKYYNNLGLAYKADNRRMEASVSFRKAIEMDPSYLEAYINIAQMQTEDKEFERAIDNYNTALELTPDKPKILTKLAAAYIEKDDLSFALDILEKTSLYLIPYYKSVLANDFGELETTDTEVKSLFRMGVILNLFAERYYAGLCMAKVIAIDPNCSLAYGYFANIVNSNPMPTKNNIHASLIEKTTLAYLGRDDMSHGHMRAQVISIIDIDGATPEVMKLIASDRPLLFLKNSPRLLAILSNLCFLALLKSSSINNWTVEKLITQARRCLFFYLISPDDDDKKDILDKFSPFIFALSCQCFLNEYVYYIDQEEQSSLPILERSVIEKLDNNTSDAPIYAAMLGCYQSLGSSPDIIKRITLTHFIENPDISSLVTLQISNPEAEKVIAESTKQFKTIENSTSQLVRQQYEENPYPRWASTFRLPPHPVDFLVKKTIYPNTPENIPKIANPEVLVAGSGTGQHPISCALYYANASVLAVDLSLASLSYAQRQANEMNINNIEFMQADILELGSLEKKFDVIESSGVLHHMKDPLAGWKVLEKLLKPNGLMKIGLYSELARTNVVAARNFISEQGFESTPEGIRECRRIIQGMDDNNIVKSVAKWSDFFSTSMVRDLIFHSMEHRFTIPQIEEILNSLNLEFLGFCSFGSNHKTQYLSQFPEDKSATSLTNWHIYETRNPDTFQGMYQFWLRKRE